MKKTICPQLLAAVIILTACQDNITENNDLQGIRATIVNDEDAATRAVMIDAPTQAVNLKWTAGDAIGVFDAANGNTRFEATATDISNDSTQAVFRANGATPQAEFLAYYPFSKQASGTGTELHLNMGAKQQYIMREFKTEPDPEACIMVGKGYANSVEFRNVNAILKVNYVPRDSDLVTAVVFRDLSGQPVSGAFTVTIDSDGKPWASYPTTGDGQTIMLDCGSGVSVAPTFISTFFLAVPAREYTKGFQLDFQLASGKTDVRTIGRQAGKRLARSMVYSVGDVSVVTKDDYSVVFGEEGGVIMDDDLMAMVKAIKPLGEMTGEDDYGTYYDLIVQPGTGLKKGMTVVINHLSEVLPYGLTGKVVAIRDLGSTQQVRVKKYRHAEEAYKLLRIGPADAFNADGTVNEEKTLPLDLTSHYSRFVPAEGMEGVTIEMTNDGLVLTDQSWNAAMETTRASMQGDLKFPRFAINLKSTNTDRISVGAAPYIKAGVAAQIADGELHYLGFTLTPKLTLDVSIEKTFELASFLDEEKVIGTMFFTPITVGPVVLIPEFKLSGYANIAGNLKVNATWSYTLGFNVGVSYQKDKGWMYRMSNQGDGVPTPTMLFPDLSTSLNMETQLGIALDAGLSFYGLIDWTLFTKLGMKFSSVLTWGNFSLMMAPVAEAGSAIGLIGSNPKRTTHYQLDSDPWWQRDMFPFLKIIHIRSKDNSVKGVFPGNKATIPLWAQMSGYLLQDVQMHWRVTRHKRGYNTEQLVSSHLMGNMPASSLLYSGENVKEMEFWDNIPLTVDEDYIYTITVYCKSPDAYSGQDAPAVTGMNKIELWLEKDVNFNHYDEKGVYWGSKKGDCILWRSTNMSWKVVEEDGEKWVTVCNYGDPWFYTDGW